MRTKRVGKERSNLRPKSIPSLTSAQFRVVTKEMERAPTQADFDRIARVKNILKHNLR
jgi:hypothetical protein